MYASPLSDLLSRPRHGKRREIRDRVFALVGEPICIMYDQLRGSHRSASPACSRDVYAWQTHGRITPLEGISHRSLGNHHCNRSK
jgi:hypothetical protein